MLYILLQEDLKEIRRRGTKTPAFEINHVYYRNGPVCPAISYQQWLQPCFGRWGQLNRGPWVALGMLSKTAGSRAGLTLLLPSGKGAATSSAAELSVPGHKGQQPSLILLASSFTLKGVAVIL